MFEYKLETQLLAKRMICGSDTVIIFQNFDKMKSDLLKYYR